MPTDGDTTSGPSVTLDPNGNALLNYNSIATLSDDAYLVTPTAGSAFIVPIKQFVNGDPGVQASSGSVLIQANYARSLGII